MSLACQVLITGFGLRGTATYTHHIAMHWRCKCGEVTTLCRLCGQPLQQDRYGRWFAMLPRRKYMRWVGNIEWYKRHGFLWESVFVDLMWRRADADINFVGKGGNEK